MGVKGLAASAVVVMAAGVCASAAQAQPAGLWIIDGPPGGDSGTFGRAVSADGRVVAGNSSFTGFTWTREGGRAQFDTTPLVRPVPAGLSGDGTVVAGTASAVGLGQRAFVRDSVGTLTDLGTLVGDVNSFANGLSRDGRVAVGNSATAVGPNYRARAFRWTAQEGMSSLPGSQPLHDEVIARATSADGSVVVGYSTNLNGADFADAFVWRNGVTTALPERDWVADAWGVSADGRYVVGDTGYIPTAVRWDLVTGEMLEIGAGVAGFGRGVAVSDDGRVVVGGVHVWREGVGAQTLSEYAASFSIALPPGVALAAARGISADGRTIVGTALVNGTMGRAFVLTIPTPGAVVMLGLAGVVASRRRR
jgi:probable HAF family extracellular repeat protein